MQPLFRRLPWPEILILLLAAVLRFAALELKPPHFDEGVNGWFADQMSHTGYYRYDPTNYHGPLHMYAVFAAQKLLGREVWAIRLPVVLVGLVCVWLTLRFGRFVGSHAAHWAALAAAVSPCATFYGRYSIHETWLLAFLLLTAWGILEIWKNGTRTGVFALAGGIAGMILTKETYFIHLGCFALAVPTLLLWQFLSPSRPTMPLAPRGWKPTDALLAVGLAVFAIVLFYSGTFLHWPGVLGLYETYAAWFKTGVAEGGHAKSAYDLFTMKIQGRDVVILNAYWLDLMRRYEWPALLGLAGCVRLLWPAPAQLRYLAITGAGTLVAYTIIPYKTPWLLLPMLWPFWFVFGALMQEYRHLAAVAFTGASVIAISLVTAVKLNFVDFDNPAQPYVYVQTHRSIAKLTEPWLDRVKRDPAARHFFGEFYLDSYYPLPWIFGEFTNVSYPQGLPQSAVIGDVIAAEVSKAPDVEKHLPEPYIRREFRLRDAQEDCVVWFRARLFAEDLPGEPVVGPLPTPAP